MVIVTRFAPSPTGHLHLGSAYSALFAERSAREQGGRFLLRIEDIDQERCKAEFEADMIEDLKWLGLEWEEPVRRQSDHMDDYQNAIRALDEMGLVYPCFCSRKEIRAEIKAASSAPHFSQGPEGPLYPGTCRHMETSRREDRMQAGDPFVLRLKSSDAMKQAGPLTWFDLEKGRQTVSMEALGDVVLARKDTPTSYHVSVTVDDHIQGITRVTRGDDLFAVTPVHRLLQALLGYPEPEYHHHTLLCEPDGQRLSKRDKSLSVRYLRDQGKSPEQVREIVHAMV